MKDQRSNWLQLSSIGFQIVASLLLFGWIGHLIDEIFSIDPVGLIAGLIIGGLGSLYQIWKITSS